MNDEEKILERIKESNKHVRSNTILAMGASMVVLGIVASFFKDALPFDAIYPAAIISGFITCVVVDTDKEYR